MNIFLNKIYNSIFNEAFDIHNQAHRQKMQYSIYLLQEIGVPVNYIDDYCFFWMKNGPVSIDLQTDMCDCSNIPSCHIELSQDLMDAIEKIKTMIGAQKYYEVKDWMKCLIYIHYIYKYESPREFQFDFVIKRLSERAPYFENKELNIIAFNLIVNL